MFKNLLMETIFVGVILLIFWMVGSDEITRLFSEDTGSIIISLGLLLIVASFFRIHNSLSNGIFSFAVGLGMLIFGFCLWKAGLFHAICVTGIYLLLITFIFYPYLDPSLRKLLLMVEILMIIIGGLFIPLSTPTKRTEAYYKDNPNITWYLELRNYGQICTGKEYVYEREFTGIEADALKELDKMEEQYLKQIGYDPNAPRVNETISITKIHFRKIEENGLPRSHAFGATGLF